MAAIAAPFSPAPAQERLDFGPFYALPEIPQALFLDGQIEADSAAALYTALETLGPTHTLFIEDSPGGLADEAVAIADIIQSYRLSTFVSPGGLCASACVLVFFAGTGRTVQGDLVLHRVSLGGGPEFENIVNPVLESLFETALARYGAPSELINLMRATPPDAVHFLSRTEIEAWHVERSRADGMLFADREASPLLPPAPRPGPPKNFAAETVARTATYLDFAAADPAGTSRNATVIFSLLQGPHSAMLRADVEIPDLGATLSFTLAESAGDDGPLFGHLATGSMTRSGRPEALAIVAILVNYPSGYPGVRNFEERLVGAPDRGSPIGRFLIFGALRPKSLSMLDSAVMIRFVVSFEDGAGILSLPVGDEAARLVDEAVTDWAAR